METNYLLPNRYKKIGWIVFIPSFILGILWLIFEFEPAFLDIKVLTLFHKNYMGSENFIAIVDNNIANELIGLFLIIGASFIVFGKEKNEDEYISRIRLESLVRAIYINYGILIFALLFIYDAAFYTVMIINMFTVLVFFIIHFNWTLYKLKKSS